MYVYSNKDLNGGSHGVPWDTLRKRKMDFEEKVKEEY